MGVQEVMHLAPVAHLAAIKCRENGTFPQGTAASEVLVRVRRLRQNTVLQANHQFYGNRLYIGNATGCSSIWGGSAPSTSYSNANSQKLPQSCSNPARKMRTDS